MPDPDPASPDLLLIADFKMDIYSCAKHGDPGSSLTLRPG